MNSVLADNLVSKPVGVVQLTIPQKTQSLVSLPLQPFSNSIDSVLAGQLTGSTNELVADRIYKWDAVVSSYRTALKMDGSGLPELDGKWFADFTTFSNTDLTLSPGEGFFIENRQGATQSVFIVGQIVLDATNTTIICPGLNLLGYPFSSAGLNPIGKGFWEANTTAMPRAYFEARPYADAFQNGGEVPTIMGITIGSSSNPCRSPAFVQELRRGEQSGYYKETNGSTSVVASLRDASVYRSDRKEAVLSVRSVGATLDIFYKDLAPTDPFQSDRDWLIAESNIVVTGKDTIEWIDQGSDNRPPINEVFARYYMVARVDIDKNANGIPDARERFLKDYAPVPATSGTIGGIIDAAVTPLPLNENGSVTYYVNGTIGNDNWNGLHPEKGPKKDGPKRTIHSALYAAVEGDTIVVSPGVYSEKKVIVTGMKLIALGRVEIK